jgi:D-arabinono-1,4-lactone oxidase
MQLFKQIFDERGFKATSFYSTELYAGYKSERWLSPSYKQDTFRIDLFWYINNEGNPAAEDGYFAQFWEMLKKNNIPFRLHWGKFIPQYDYNKWIDYYREQFPRWNDFMKLRQERDPENIFLNSYWRRHFLGEE